MFRKLITECIDKINSFFIGKIFMEYFVTYFMSYYFNSCLTIFINSINDLILIETPCWLTCQLFKYHFIDKLYYFRIVFIITRKKFIKKFSCLIKCYLSTWIIIFFNHSTFIIIFHEVTYFFNKILCFF